MKFLSVFAAILASGVTMLHATVDDAQSFALEAADPWVKKGVEVRYDYAKGSTESGRPVKVSYQVFKGNRYWFFAGGSEDGVKLNMVFRDAAGAVIEGESSIGTNSATFNFTAPRTMMVSIELTGTIEPARPFDWAIVYGYQPKGAKPLNGVKGAPGPKGAP